ncbi:alpha/beta fold hydrolase [Nocardia sp. KC 131]|uniref:alpha/beta fold hydrolase n=1 Tax=Nocardia arseniciresistens TaxID=3392119 RepID=UPI00398F1146
MSITAERHALVFGATGFLGRHLILALDDAGIQVTAATRSKDSYQQLISWLQDHGHQSKPNHLPVDFESSGLGLSDPSSLRNISEIYNCAGAYRFGMTTAEARHSNVDSAREIIGLAAKAPDLLRLVHVSGYRVGGQDPTLVPWSAEHVKETYTELGAYEASKVESDAVVQSEADRLGVPWTIVNPSTVSGVSDTGETDQYLGLAASLKELWQGSLTARPGNASTFVPVVPVDYLSQFMAMLPGDPATNRRAYWVLDDATPALPDLLTQVGRHYRVKVPRARIPVALIKGLPSSVTKADRETLTFLSTDRYPTSPALELAEGHGLHMPDTIPSMMKWADHLAAYRFGATASTGLPRRFTSVAAARTFEIGSPTASTLVLPGLPINADTWASVAADIGDTRVLDLPGLGMSTGTTDWGYWLNALLTSTSPSTNHLIGHSIGAAAAVEAAAAHPDRIGHLTLVAPFFLQNRAGASVLLSTLTRLVLRRVDAESLSRRLTGTVAYAAELQTSAEDLRRGQTGAHVAALLKKTRNQRWRSGLGKHIQQFPGTVHVIVGDQDPLAEWAPAMLDTLGSRIRISTIPGAGHYPHITHPQELVNTILEHHPIPSQSHGNNR